MKNIRILVDGLFGYCHKGDEFTIDEGGGISTHCWTVKKEKIQEAIQKGYIEEIK